MFVCMHICRHVCAGVCTLYKTMTVVSEVLKDLGVNQLPGYQSVFVGSQFACMQLTHELIQPHPYTYMYTLSSTYKHFSFSEGINML